ncbi:MAG: stage III sporulation protein AA [Firmicutes bacterium]|nr:stage III sporulation protein AA [Bacillota bacterium]
MFALAQENKDTFSDLLTALPERIRTRVLEVDTDKLLEIRMRRGESLCAVLKSGCYLITPSGSLSRDNKNSLIVTEADIKRALELITNFSLYAYENEIKNGFVTLPGGHRVGVCGEAASSSGKITHLKSIQSLNYRFAREVPGCSDSIMDRILAGTEIKNTLIVSPPMCGKTTLLRDIARNLSLSGKRVSIVDERGEIAAAFGGTSPFDLGVGCDILSGAGKADGMLFMLRSMSPDVIITDEIGTADDFLAIREIKRRGVSIITSLHGKDTKIPDFDTVIKLEGIGVYA